MSTSDDPRWIVLKFGGTSVSSLINWRNIVAVVKQRRSSTGARVLIVHSAVSGVTDRLERLLSAALVCEHEAALSGIESRHRELTAELGIGVSDTLENYFTELRQIAAGICLMTTISDRTRARVMATGELMATEIGARYLQSQGIAAAWWDAREGLKAEQRGASARASLLSATCNFAPDAPLVQHLGSLGDVVITQGFIASDAEGDTVLLGRGGSDTSGAYLAAKLTALRLEIWTDVPGMFSANPRSTPSARLLRGLHYDEAQEIASSGAKVLHPRCILPVRQYQIPLYVYATHTPDLEGTHISASPGDGSAKVKAVCVKKGITLVSLESPGMWHEVGFLADAFQIFKMQGLSVDLVSTSETNVTVSLDPAANTLDALALEALVAALSKLCRVQIIGPCASVSLVGRNIRAILHQLGEAFELFEEQKIHLVSQAANDLNFTFVVDESQADRLVEQLHELLIRPVPGDKVLGPTWEQLFAKATPEKAKRAAWWQTAAPQIVAALEGRDSAYIYDRATIRTQAQALRKVKAFERVLYAMKANPHPDVLRVLHAEGIGMECVSRGEIERVLQTLPEIEPKQILYTPNFAPRAEYAWALELGVQVTIDNLHALREWPAMFKGRSLFVRIDTGTGRGHHQHVRTAGLYSKFGVPLSEIDELQQLAQHAGAKIIGLHAHTGSGVFDIGNWIQVAQALGAIAQKIATVRTLDIGGGFGVPDSVDEPVVDLSTLDTALLAFKQEHPQLALWTEPGRFLVATAGVLLARVTQIKKKGEVGYVGVATGMNSLIRPALYGAYHEIVNLTRSGEAASELYDVVGPICETADVFGHGRLLPHTVEGDLLLVANAGAYGHAMASQYNLRMPAEELLF
ncbi:MAG: bifunctional aspartate kinase/diaminopimelate decarboxylase [Steroidobacteraceae bacterium]